MDCNINLGEKDGGENEFLMIVWVGLLGGTEQGGTNREHLTLSKSSLERGNLINVCCSLEDLGKVFKGRGVLIGVNEMEDPIRDLMTTLGIDQLGTFQPRARFNHSMGSLTYRILDETSVSHPIDQWLTVMYAGDLDQLVGMRFEDFGYHLKEFIEDRDMVFDGFFPLRPYLEAALDRKLERYMVYDLDGRSDAYEQAIELAKQVTLTPEDVAEILGGR